MTSPDPGLSTVNSDKRSIIAIGDDGAPYPMDKLEAHERGQLHEAISVFVFDGPEMLLQQRAAGKYHCGGLWANACCTHPDWGETHEASAHRRLKEELGIGLALQEISETVYRADVGQGLIEHEHVRVFLGRTDRDGLNFRLNPEEVSAVRWADRESLEREAAHEPAVLTPWLRIYLERWDELGLPSR